MQIWWIQSQQCDFNWQPLHWRKHNPFFFGIADRICCLVHVKHKALTSKCLVASPYFLFFSTTRFRCFAQYIIHSCHHLVVSCKASASAPYVCYTTSIDFNWHTSSLSETIAHIMAFPGDMMAADDQLPQGRQQQPAWARYLTIQLDESQQAAFATPGPFKNEIIRHFEQTKHIKVHVQINRRGFVGLIKIQHCILKIIHAASCVLSPKIHVLHFNLHCHWMLLRSRLRRLQRARIVQMEMSRYNGRFHPHVRHTPFAFWYSQGCSRRDFATEKSGRISWQHGSPGCCFFSDSRRY